MGKGKAVPESIRKRAIAIAKKTTAQDAAQRLGVARSSVYKWVLADKKQTNGRRT